MFCKNCGNPLNENAAFCPNCGVKVGEVVVPEPVVEETAAPETVEAPVVEAVNANIDGVVETPVEASVELVAETPVEEAPAELVSETVEFPADETPEVAVAEAQSAPVEETQEAVYAEEPVPVKKSFFKKFLTKKVGITAGVLLVLGGIVAGAYPFLETMYIKTFGSPKQYLGYVIEKNLDEGLDEFPEIWDMAMRAYTDGLTAEETVDIEIGDGLTELVEDLGGGDISPYIDWLDTVNLSVKATTKDFESAADIGLKVNNVDFGKIVYGADSKDGSFYFGIPDYNPDFLGYEPEYNDGIVGGMLFTADAGIMSDVFDALPDGEKTEAILKKYVKCAAKGVKNVTKAKETITANEVEQKVTALTVAIDGETAKSVSLEILNELKKDEDIKNIVYNVADAVGEERPDYENEIQEAIDDCSEWEPGDDLVELKIYVDGNDKIVGLYFAVEEVNFEFVSARNGDELGERLTLNADMASVTYEGGGKVSGNKLTADFVISAMGVDFVEIAVEDYDLEKAKKGLFNGSITIDVCDTLARIPGADIPREVCDLSLKISGKMDSLEKGSAEVALLYDGDVCVKISADEEIKDAESIERPHDFISMDDNSALNEWLYGIDFEKLIGNLGKVGLPDEFMNTLEMGLFYLNNPDGVEGDEYGVYGDYGSYNLTDDYYDAGSIVLE